MKVDKLVKNVYETIMASGMICQGDSVVVGVSGGADSVCLLSVLKNLQMSMALQLTAVHIHHGLRGEAADRGRDLRRYADFVCVFSGRYSGNGEGAAFIGGRGRKKIPL